MPDKLRGKTDKAFNLHKAGKLDDAEFLYKEVLGKAPKNFDVLNLLGLLKFQNKNFDEAVFYLEKAVELNRCAYFCEGLGRAYLEAGRYDEAIKTFQKGLIEEPKNFELLFYLALTYKKIGLLEKAISTYKSAADCVADDSQNLFNVWFNIACTYELDNQTELAIAYYKKALEYNQHHIETNYFLATSLLKLKNFDLGWKYFEMRPSKILSYLTQHSLFPELVNPETFWQGEDLRDKTIYVYYEGGLGDTIMFARYLKLLAQQCKKVIFAPQSSLMKLFSDNFDNIDVIDSKNASLISDNEIKFDVHLPIMSLPFAMQKTCKTIPYETSYLYSEDKKTNWYQEKYFSSDKINIGIKWQGNPDIGQNRIIPLSSFENLFEIPNTKFYSLQTEDGMNELTHSKKYQDIINLGVTFKDFSDTAAAIKNLDLIICNDTSIAHLAGAMGIPCFVILPYQYNWRWHNDLSFSPWYKSVELFRQSLQEVQEVQEAQHWDEVFDLVHKRISIFKK